MCKFLKVSRNMIYYKYKEDKVDSVLENLVIKEFVKSRKNYGTRKLKRVLVKHNYYISRKTISKIMKKYDLVSNYIITTKKSKKISKVNNDKIPNKLNREFSNKSPLEVVVSDLTYVKVAGKWNYICLLLDLNNREIIGSAVGKRKDAQLVKTAFFSVQSDLRRIKLFHTDRGSEFKNEVVENILTAFNIDRSLSDKGTPVDNSVAESTYNIVKREFANHEFNNLHQLEILWFDYVNWYNNVRIHGSLNYLTPVEFKTLNLKIEKL